jgi:hypothetical protein
MVSCNSLFANLIIFPVFCYCYLLSFRHRFLMSKFLLALYKAVRRIYFDSKKCNFIPVTSVVHGYIVFEPSAYMNTL